MSPATRARVLRLEDFGQPGGRPTPEQSEAMLQACAEAEAKGFAEGFAQAMETAEAEDRAAVQQLREAMQDVELSQAAARGEAIARLRPLIEALARVAAPQAAAAGFDLALADAVEAQLKAAPAQRLTARTAPARAEGLRLRFGDRVSVVADPDLSGAQALLEWDGGGAELDVDGCLAAACAAIARFFGETSGEISNVG